MLNKVILQGRLVADPELKQTPSGVSVATFRMAVDRDYKNKETGEKDADFVTIVAWRTTAEFVSKFFAKGRMCVVDGRLQIRPYTDKDGNKRNATEVVAENVYFGDSRRDGEVPGGMSYGTPAPAYGMPAPGGDQFSEVGDDDGDLPF